MGQETVSGICTLYIENKQTNIQEIFLEEQLAEIDKYTQKYNNVDDLIALQKQIYNLKLETGKSKNIILDTPKETEIRILYKKDKQILEKLVEMDEIKKIYGKVDLDKDSYSMAFLKREILVWYETNYKEYNLPSREELQKQIEEEKNYEKTKGVIKW